ncbi:MAG: N-methyl-L-tryptophan oxidase [Verrucomicrobiales bacterium]
MNCHDVIVIGLGGMGSAAAYHLAARGRRVLGLDQFSLPHRLGSSHGHTRVIRQAYFEHPAYVPLLLRSYELWKYLERRNTNQLLLLCGGLMMGAPDSSVVAGSLESARQHGLAHELLTTRDIERRYPPFRMPRDTVALFEREAGIVFCELAVTAHLQQATRAGAELHMNEPVLEWHVAPGGGVLVKTAGATHTADQLVITPGPWAPQLLAELAIPLRIERQVLYWFRPRNGVGPFLPERFPIYVWQRSDGSLPYGFPAVDGSEGGVKVAFYRKPQAELCTAESVDRKIRADDVSEMRAACREFLPALDGELLEATVCLYTLSPDLNFVIGYHPAHPQVKIAAGFSGHGFKFCTVVGEILADLVSDGRTNYDISLFDPMRSFE